MAIHLIADDIIRTAGATALEFCANAGINPKELIAYESHTFLFPSDQMLVFARAVDRKLPPGKYMAPFLNVIIQFTEPIPERDLLGIDAMDYEPGDAGPMAGLLIRFPLTGED